MSLVAARLDNKREVELKDLLAQRKAADKMKEVKESGAITAASSSDVAVTQQCGNQYVEHFEKKDALGVGFEIASLRDIDPVAGTFGCSMLLSFFKVVPDLHDHPTGSVKGFKERWDTLIQINENALANGAGIDSFDYWRNHLVHCVGQTEIRGLMRVLYWAKGRFSEDLELHDFPYDAQSLSVQVRSMIGGINYELIPIKEWTLFKFELEHPEYHIYKPPMCVRISEGGHKTKHRVIVSAFVQRKPWFFVLNVMMLLGGLTTMSFLTFGIDADDLGAKASISLTLILTVVAFRFVVADTMPKLVYSTMLDKYINTNYVFLAIVVCENALAKVESSFRTALDCSIALLWIIFNACFFVRASAFQREMAQRLESLTGDVYAAETEATQALHAPEDEAHPVRGVPVSGTGTGLRRMPAIPLQRRVSWRVM
mmetsp:Transcript_52440/g.105064  ORF Transcript_52440/g.105064 Transcript_52440/m.105064 type:complete len:428 (-) Transcript_52440:254-1537(-)